MDLNELTEIWAQFVYEDKMDPRVRPEIADSWRKCKAAGVNPVGGAGRRVDDVVFKSICAANQTLIDTALPIMQSVFEIVKKSHFLLVLTDSVGYVLKTIGDENVLLRTEDLRFAPGALWNSAQVGTNAISAALDYDIPIQTVGPEHYCRGHHGWTCSAAPIHGINGEVIGCINMSGDVSAAHDHTLGLVLATAFGIEGHLRLLHNVEIMRAALEGSADGILLLNEDYRPIWMNSASQHLLGLTLPELESRDFRGLTPGVDWASLNWREGQRYFADDVRVETSTGVLRCSAAISPSLDYGTKTLSVTLKKQSHLIKTVNKMSGNRARYTFEDIYTRDPAMKKTLSLARKYADYDGNILIQGESGTGKSTLIKMIVGELYPDDGRIRTGPQVKEAYLPQVVEFDHPDWNLVENMMAAKRGLSAQSARNRLAAYDFRGEDVMKPVSVLSGGEQSRLRLCMLMDDEINFLILDEPTNHLDIDSREWIEEAVEAYDGTLLFVSHDRYFINRFATRIWEVSGGTITDYPMGFAQYRQVKAQEEAEKQETAKPVKEKPTTERPQRGNKAQQAARRQLTICERDIAKAEERIAALEADMEAAACDYEKLNELVQEKEAAQAELDALYERWEQLSEEAEG